MVKLYEFKEYDKVVALGDIHGDFRTLAYQIKRRGFYNTLFIVCGDCGFGFHKIENYNIEMDRLSRKLEEDKNGIIFFRGNHDDPKYYQEELINLPNVKTVPDYSVINVKDSYILCVGGAISIDRRWRTQQEIIINLHNPNKESHKKLYWKNEQVIYDEDKLNEISEMKLPINAICTHSAPSFCPPTTKNNIQAWLLMDENLEKDLEIERSTLDKLFEYAIKHFKVKKWAYGHFHKIENGEDSFSETANIEFKMIRCLGGQDYSFDCWTILDSNQTSTKSAYSSFKIDYDGQDALIQPNMLGQRR